MISYFLPPKNGKSSKEKLLETIDYLEARGIDEQAFKILNALAEGLLWSEESDTRIRNLGKQIAQGLYDEVTINAEREAYSTDPNNPSNWS